MHWHWEDRYAIEQDGSKKRNWRILRKLLPYFRKYLKTIIIASFLLLFSTLLTLLGPILIRRAIDVEIPDKNVQGLIIIAVAYIIIQIVVILVRYFQQIEIMSVGERAIADLKADIFRHLLRLPISYFDKHPIGH